MTRPPFPCPGFAVEPGGATVPLTETVREDALRIVMNNNLTPSVTLPQRAPIFPALVDQLTAAEWFTPPVAGINQIRTSLPPRRGGWPFYTKHPLKQQCSTISQPRLRLSIHQSHRSLSPNSRDQTLRNLIGEEWADVYFDKYGCWIHPDTDLTQPGALFAAHTQTPNGIRWNAGVTGFDEPAAEAAWDDTEACTRLFRMVAGNDRAAALNIIKNGYRPEQLQLFHSRLLDAATIPAIPAAREAFNRPRDRIKPRVLAEELENSPLGADGWSIRGYLGVTHKLLSPLDSGSPVNAAYTFALWDGNPLSLNRLPPAWLAYKQTRFEARKAGRWMRWTFPEADLGGVMVVNNPTLVAEHAAAFGIPDGAAVETFNGKRWVTFGTVNCPVA